MANGTDSAKSKTVPRTRRRKRSTETPAKRSNGGPGAARSSAGSRVHLPVEPSHPIIRRDEEAAGRRRPKSRGGVEGETQIRFRLAGLVRISDNLVTAAVRAYDRVFDISSAEKSEIYLEMGREFLQTGKIPEALSALRRAVELRPDLPAAYVLMGRIYMRRNAEEAAEEAFLKARDLGENGAGLCSCLAEVLIAQGKDQEAMEELERVALLSPDEPKVWYRLGFLNDRLGRYEEALEAFAQAIELDPAEAAYHQGMGFTLESMGRRSEAIRCFKRALELEQRGLV